MIADSIIASLKKDNWKKLRFLVVGGWNTFFGWGLFTLLWFLWGTEGNYVAIAIGAHFIAVTQAYFLYARHVFSSTATTLNDRAREFLRFNLSYVGSLVFGVSALWAMVSKLGIHPVAAQGITLAMGAAISYVAHDRFSFGKKNIESGGSSG